MFDGLQTAFMHQLPPQGGVSLQPQHVPLQTAPLQQPMMEVPAPHPAVAPVAQGTNQYMKGLQDYFKKQAEQQTAAAENFDTGYRPLQLAQATLK